MDDNTKDALIAVAGIAGTLLGVAGGSLLERGREDRDQRRSAYVRLLAIAYDVRSVVMAGVRYHPRDTSKWSGPGSETWLKDAAHAVGLIELVAPKAVVDAAHEVSAALGAFATAATDASGHDDPTFKPTIERFENAIIDFKARARADL